MTPNSESKLTAEPPTLAPMIELRNLGLRFREVGKKDLVVFEDISLKIFPGDSVVLIGPSGQGKSSLLRLLGSLLPPTSGEVFWGGTSVSRLTQKQRLAWLRRIGMLFQRNALFDSMTIFENVAFPIIETTTLSRGEVEQRVEKYLQSVYLAESATLYPNQISGGMQKRLGIARALALEPHIMLYDDPTAGLDPITSRKIMQLIKELQLKFKATTVTVTNDMNRAFQLAGRIIFVNETKLVETGDKRSTLEFADARVQQFIQGLSEGPLTKQI